jgi:hypothetical protein
MQAFLQIRFASAILLVNEILFVPFLQLQGSDSEAGEDSEECEMPLLFWPPSSQTSVSEPLNWDPSGASLQFPTFFQELQLFTSSADPRMQPIDHSRRSEQLSAAVPDHVKEKLQTFIRHYRCPSLTLFHYRAAHRSQQNRAQSVLRGARRRQRRSFTGRQNDQALCSHLSMVSIFPDIVFVQCDFAPLSSLCFEHGMFFLVLSRPTQRFGGHASGLVS